MRGFVIVAAALVSAVVASSCVVVADGRSNGKLEDDEIALLNERCGEDGWFDGRYGEEPRIETRFPQGTGPAELSPPCLIVRRGQSVRIEVADGRHAEFRFPEESPFAANLFRVDGKRGATLRVTESAQCPLSADRFGCKYDVAEAENSRREVLDPIIVIKGGGGTGQ